MIVKRCAVLAVMLLGAAACRGEAETQPKLATIEVKLGERKFTLEVADTDATRSRGLMFRKSMPADHGMLFVFDVADTWGFWMKNTEIPLDLVFLDRGGKVIGIYGLKPRDEKPVGPDKPASFAIEINAGRAKEVGLKVGDTVALPEKVLKGVVRSDDK